MEGVPTNAIRRIGGEAAAFYALSLLASEPDGDTTFANRKQAAAVLEKLFRWRCRRIPGWRTT